MTGTPNRPWSTIFDDELKLLREIAHAAYHGEREAALDLAVLLKERYYKNQEDLPR